MIARVEHLEQAVNSLMAAVHSLQAQLAAVEQKAWQYGGGGGGMFAPVQVDWFLLTSALAGAALVSGTWTPGSGTANRVRWNGTAWATLDSGVTVWTANESTVASGAFLRCAQTTDGTWWADVPDACANLS